MQGNGNFFVDLVIMVLLGVFIYTRFFSTKLPKDDKTRKQQKPQNVLDFPKTTVPETPVRPQRPKRPNPKDLADLKGTDLVRAYDPMFNEKEFLAGAREAYRMFHSAVAERDEETLENLLSPRLFDRVLDELDTLKGKDSRKLTTIDGFDDISIIDARINGRTVILDVKYNARQAQAVVKAKGAQPKSTPQAVTEIWTWARNADAQDPNWELEDIRVPS